MMAQTKLDLAAFQNLFDQSRKAAIATILNDTPKGSFGEQHLAFILGVLAAGIQAFVIYYGPETPKNNVEEACRHVANDFLRQALDEFYHGERFSRRPCN